MISQLGPSENLAEHDDAPVEFGGSRRPEATVLVGGRIAHQSSDHRYEASTLRSFQVGVPGPVLGLNLLSDRIAGAPRVDGDKPCCVCVYIYIHIYICICICIYD